MQQEKLTAELKKNFKLNIYEAKIWTALLSRGIASAGELADISGVPRSRCYDVLEGLEKKGFIIMKIGKPIKYLAVQPEIVVERVKKGVESEANSMVSQVNSILGTEDFRELELLHKSGIKHVDIDSISRSIVGRTAVNKQIKDILSNAKSEVLVVSTSEHAERLVKVIKNFAAGFSKKGIKFTFYGPYSKSSAKKIGESSFKEAFSTTSFVSVDGTDLMFMVSNESVAPDYEVAVWISSPFFVKAVNLLFEQSVKK